MMRCLFNSRSSLVATCRGLSARLARDQRGNAFIMVAAALIPMLAAIGSGVDISRAYMAQSRLQAAADSAALAGRRARIGTGMTEAETAANKFLVFNFPKTAYGAQESDWSSAITPPDANSVQVTASTRIPTTVMRFFGYQSIPISATSIARQNWINTDILLVLDTTGSMDNSLNGTKKIVSLRSAVLDLYDELQEAQTNLEARGLRLRYGILPYSSAVNVGRLLRAENTSYVRTNAPYNKRYCSRYYSNGDCRNYSYHDVDVDVSSEVASSSISVWAGCIEERQTDSSITSSSGYSIPSGALDLNIDLVPNGNASRWAPYLPDEQQGESQVACPTQAKLLQTWATKSDLSTYLNTLNPNGGTYHDIGMIWGARMISPLGVFPNPTEYAGAPVSRHIIFMTDGILDTGPSLYSSYGVETYQGRVSGSYSSESDLNSRHRQRFLMVCNAARGLNITIWTVAFATGADSTLTSCSGAADRSFTASNASELSDKFKEIGRSIGKLRVAQ